MTDNQLTLLTRSPLRFCALPLARFCINNFRIRDRSDVEEVDPYPSLFQKLVNLTYSNLDCRYADI
jgi:hypothetical protein